jgi:hypothetical protein
MALQPFVWSWPLFQFLNPYTVGRIPWTGDQLVARPLPTHRTTQKQNKCTQTSMPRVEFEPTTPAFERLKTIHTSGCEATAISFSKNTVHHYPFIFVHFIQVVLFPNDFGIKYCHLPGFPWLIVTGSRLGDWIYWHIFTQLETTDNCSSPLHTHQDSQSSLIVSWQRIYHRNYHFKSLWSLLAISCSWKFRSLDPNSLPTTVLYSYNNWQLQAKVILRLTISQ